MQNSTRSQARSGVDRWAGYRSNARRAESGANRPADATRGSRATPNRIVRVERQRFFDKVPLSVMSRLRPWLVLAGLTLCVSGCFRGAEREKKAPPGVPGGLCLAPDGVCQDGMCNREENYCYDPQDPCKGFFCGGSERGICIVADNEPSCSCQVGYEKETFSLYCCPEDSTQDVICAQAQDGG